jgi:hypothetical protein
MADYKILSGYDKNSIEASVKSHIANGYVLGDFTVTGFSTGGYSSQVIYAQVVYKPKPVPGFINNKLSLRMAATPSGGGGGGGSRKRKTRKFCK